MPSIDSLRRGVVRIAAAFLLSFVFTVGVSAQCISLTSLGAASTQNFDALGTSGTSSTLPDGWALSESGTNANATYTAGTGSSNTGDTYSFGAAAATERALGGLLSGSLVPTLGACFTNNTGELITAIAVNYKGEHWRLGTAGRADRLDFQYSTDATSLTTGAWTDTNELDFTSIVQAGTVGALNGNTNSTVITHTISSLTIPNGATFWIRWTDFNASGADDGLAVDDFSLTPQGSAGQPLSITTAGPLPGATLFTFYTTGFVGAGGTGNYTWSLIGTPPPGLNLVGSTLSGTPNSTVGSPFGFTIQLFDGVTTVTKPFELAVTAPVCNNPVAISSIQGSGSTSPVANTVTTALGIVTGLKSNGFFMQSALGDGNPATSEGLFVFTGSPVPAAAVLGNEVCVTGTITEFGTPLSLTEFSNGPTVGVMSTGNSIPAATPLAACGTGPDIYECLEGMRVSLSSLTASAPTDGSVAEASATATSNGLFFGVPTGTPRPFREPGISVLEPLPSGAPPAVPRWDGHFELLRVDSDAQPGATALNVTSGAVVTNLVGALDVGNGFYTILPEAANPPSATPNAAFTPVPVPTASELTVGAINLERFFDTVNDPGVSDVALTPAAFANRLNKASLAIRAAMNSPDVVGVVEMENLATLQALADKINADASLTGPNPGYQAFLVEGNDPGGIDVGVLAKSSRVTVQEVVQVGKTATYINPNTGLPELLNDRPPLVVKVTAAVPGLGTALPFTVVVNHLRSFLDMNDPVDGPRVRAKRKAQAEFLANELQARQATDRVISVGDYNAFQFNDGYVDVMGAIIGAPAPADQVVTPSPDLVNPNFINLVNTLPADQRYSYVFDGNAQVLDHILINTVANRRFTRFAYGRNNADFPEIFRNDASRPERISDHDLPVAYFSLEPVNVTASLAIQRPALGFSRLTNTYNGTMTIRNTTAVSIGGPVLIEFENLPAGVTLVDAAGQTASGPYVSIPGPLVAGATVQVPLRFNNPNRVAITYNVRVYSVTF